MAARRGDQGSVYRTLRTLAGRTTPPTACVKAMDGTVPDTPDQQLARWREHFENLLNRPAPPPSPQLDALAAAASEDDSVPTGPPTREEVVKAIQKLKPGRAAGADGITPELSETIPEDWLQSVILPFWKKGSKDLCSNYRGITLLSVPGKVFANVILGRLRPLLLRKQRKEQSGFTPGRSTVDRILTLRLLAEKRREFRRPLFAAYVDLKQAFDSVDRQALWKILKTPGVPAKLLTLLSLLYSNTSSSVRVNGPPHTHSVNRNNCITKVGVGQSLLRVPKGRAKRQRNGFRGVSAPLTRYQDDGTRRTTWRSLRLDDTSSSANAATTTTPSQLAATVGLGNNEDPWQQTAEPIPEDISNHQRRKRQEKEAWADQRDDLIKTGRNLATPPQNCICYLCDEEVTSTILFCQDCSPWGFFCLECFEKFHKSPSLHHPLQWKDDCFQPYVQRKILYLPHQWSCFTRDVRPLKVFDQTGRLQYIDVVVCSCESELSTLLQLGLWGASPTKPQTAFAVALLEWQCVLSMVSHVSVEAFCQAVRWKNNLTLSEKKTLYRALTGESIAEYQHYRDRMRSLQDLSPLLDDNTSCPACPKADGEQIVAIDANFGLVRKASSGVSSAPPLQGTSMFLDDKEVKEFLSEYSDEAKPPEDCSNFKAGNCLRSKAQQKKLDVTGVFGGVCRHDIPLKFANMFHGERFGYPVYLIKTLLDEASARNNRLRVIYDVACSLTAHLTNSEHDGSLPLRLAMETRKLSLAVDVFHSYGHQSLCQIKYSTRRLNGYGLTDGEGSERLWSSLRPFARMTKEMSPDHRVDKLTDAVKHFAMCKVVDIEVSLSSKLDKAIKAEMIADDNLQQAKREAGEIFSDEDIEAWREMEKIVMERSRQQTSTSTPQWKKEYLRKLIRYNKLGEKILQCQEDSTQLAVHHSAFEKYVLLRFSTQRQSARLISFS
ncbi:uncharacterized protein LOC118408831 [Branchiostoma floridae]|uniref:Uncharacterized protein LOC118408831 n=1 Tax=Branchiostoma floridae TaxID=7739 RepID=A0A9J7HUM9_BRAFL|nr:uncharacterized protein LOC118408831 [Branchiostoma floridae]